MSGSGRKTAQKLIAQFGSIENLLAHTDQLKGAIRTKVETNREQIAFSKFLATIKIDVPITLDMDALKREAPDEEALRKIFEEMEFRTLMDRVLKTEKKIAPSSTPLQGDLFGLFAPEDTDASKIQISRALKMPHSTINLLIQKRNNTNYYKISLQKKFSV